MSVSPEAPSSAQSSVQPSASPTRADRLWKILEPILYYGLVACDAFANRSVRVRVSLCAVIVILVAGGIMLQAATPPTASPNEEVDRFTSTTTEAGEAEPKKVLAARIGKRAPDRDGVVLTLRRSVRAPGSPAYAGDLLPAGTITIVYQEPGNEPHTLSNQGFASHDELIRQIISTQTGIAAPRRKGSVFVDTLTGLGQTRATYIQTGSPTTNPDRFSTITYVAAKIPNGKIYQSYVDTGSGGFLVGFDAVYSGRMTMGPVAHEHQAGMDEMFEALSVPAVNLPVLAGAIVQAISGVPSARAVTSGSARNDPVEARLERAERPARVQEKVAVASSQRVRASGDEARDRFGQAELPSSRSPALDKSQPTPASIPSASPAEDGWSDAEPRTALAGELAPDGERVAAEPEGEPSPPEGEAFPTAVRASTEDSLQTLREPQDASSADASGVSAWWVVVALFGGIAGGGAAGYSYWAREIETQAREMDQLRVAHRQEHATRTVQSIRGMMTDAPADAAAPEFDLGDEFWETSTVATRSLADGENSISDNSMDDRKRGTKDDTAWLDDLPF